MKLKLFDDPLILRPMYSGLDGTIYRLFFRQIFYSSIPVLLGVLYLSTPLPSLAWKVKFGAVGEFAPGIDYNFYLSPKELDFSRRRYATLSVSLQNVSGGDLNPIDERNLGLGVRLKEAGREDGDAIDQRRILLRNETLPKDAKRGDGLPDGKVVTFSFPIQVQKTPPKKAGKSFMITAPGEYKLEIVRIEFNPGSDESSGETVLSTISFAVK